MRVPIALELYSVRNDCAKDLMGTLRAVAKMGYEGVEFAGFHGHGADDIRATLDDVGLKCAGSHTGMDQLEGDRLGSTLDFMKTIGCEYVIVPWIAEDRRNTSEACKESAKSFSELSKSLRSRGFYAGFHAHAGDMMPLGGGESAYYLFGRNTPADFVMQYDTANGMDGGADPVQPILDFPGRGRTVHLKEWAGAHGAALIGDGEVPWKRVFDACESVAGTRWYIVEHESEELMPAMQAVKGCLENLRAMGK